MNECYGGATVPPCWGVGCLQFTPEPMILSQASRLRDRQTVWVARRNDDTPFYRLTTDYGVPATTWAAQFAEVHASDVRNVTID